jgi:hypothetical protein
VVKVVEVVKEALIKTAIIISVDIKVEDIIIELKEEVNIRVVAIITLIISRHR